MSDSPDPNPDTTLPASLHTRITDDEDLRAALGRVADAARQALPAAVAASVTLLEQGRPLTPGSTAEVALRLDEAQYRSGQGPCLTAATDQRTVVVPDVAAEQRWATFCETALRWGIRSSLSAPLRLGGATRGALNIYAAETGAFGPAAADLAETFAAHASVVVANAHAYWSTLDVTRNLTIALANRAVIEQAKGVLMARHGFTDQEAFEALKRRSQQANRKLREVAIEVVEGARRGHAG